MTDWTPPDLSRAILRWDDPIGTPQHYDLSGVVRECRRDWERERLLAVLLSRIEQLRMIESYRQWWERWEQG